MQLALVRDCLVGADRERLTEACARPRWAVAREEYYSGHYLIASAENGAAPTWKLQVGGSDGQLELASLARYIIPRRRCLVPRPAVILHPWQADPPLPSKVTIDISHHLPRSLPAPEGWEIIQRNGRVWITERRSRVVRLDAAHYSMLVASCCAQEAQRTPTAQFLAQLSESCRAQQDADRRYFVHWSRHLLASIRQVTGVELLVGASAVMFNPHFRHFVSPYPPDVHLGSTVTWLPVSALLILDSFAPQQRRKVLEQAATHGSAVWVLWQHENGSDDPCLVTLQRLARLYAELPKKSMVLHSRECWETAAWDVAPSRCVTQLWRLDACPDSLRSDPEPSPSVVQQYLNRGGHHQYAFHWSMDPAPPRLLLYRQNQQDALRHSWDGLVAGTDGSVDERAEQMGAAYVLGADPDPILTFFARVGGPLASARAEAASLLQLLKDVRTRDGHHVHLLIIVDCLVILDILRKWGRSDFHPGPKEIIHFSVVRPLIEELRQWTGNITLLKVKSHTGCLLNERADELAELGRTAEGPEICPGPQKYGSFWLRVRPETRRLAEQCGKQLPRDSAPNHSLLARVAASSALRAVRMRSTIFVTDLFDRKEGSTVSKLVRRCTPSEYRVWVKCMTKTYPTQMYLKCIGKADSPLCPHCSDGVPESLTHFACVCPKFREARTSAHNQVRDVVTSFLDSTLGPEWTMFEETRMANTGLILRSTSHATAEQWGRRQPDWVLISQHHKRIAIVDLCRPSDVHPAQLLAAAMRKQQTYLPLLEALSYYSDQGWIIHVFPWAVGIRGMIDPSHVQSLLKFLEIQHRHWHTAVEKTVLASVRAFHFLHRVRFGGRLDTARPDLDQDRSDSENDDQGYEVYSKRKPHQSTTTASPDYTDFDSPEADGLGEFQVPKKASPGGLPVTQAANTAAVGAATPPSAPNDVNRLAPSTRSRASGAVSGRRLGVTRHNSLWSSMVRNRVLTKPLPRAAPTRCADLSRSGGRQRLKRNREEHSIITTESDPNSDGQRPAKRPQRATSAAPLEVLWTRWRQMEPRKQRRT